MPTPAPDHRQSAWTDRGLIQTSPLTANLETDVCVIGAGIAGLLIAHRLSEEGRRVVMLDAGPVCGGETCVTTAHVTSALDDRYTSLERLHGVEGARIAAQSHAAAADYLERLASAHPGAEWRRVPGYLTVNEKHRDRQDQLLSDEEAAARRAGLTVGRVQQLPAPWPSSLGPALLFADQAQLHPLMLLNSLVGAMMERGVRVFTGTRARDIEGGNPATVHTEAGPVVRCAHVVVATNTPVNNVLAMHTKQSGYQTYVVAFHVPGGALPPLLLWDGLWENDAAYRYIRLMHASSDRPDDLLIVGGEDHKTGQTPDDADPFGEIEKWTRAHFPMAGAVAHRWSGEVLEPADCLAYIGRSATGKDNVYVVTGDSGNGITHAAIAAMLIPDLIAGRAHPWADLYDPARKIGMHAMRDYAQENLNTVAQYSDWLKRGDVPNEQAIAPGTGAVVVKGMKHLAVYKDESLQCTRLSAVCPHLGGLVRWNAIEKTWDCPCHASRFDRTGKVIHGPANRDLPLADGP